MGVHPSRVCFPEGGGSSWPGRASSKLGFTVARGLAISISAVTAWLGLNGPVSICWDELDGKAKFNGLNGLAGTLALRYFPSEESSTDKGSDSDLCLSVLLSLSSSSSSSLSTTPTSSSFASSLWWTGWTEPCYKISYTEQSSLTLTNI